MDIQLKIEPWNMSEIIDAKGWNIDFNQLLAKYHDYNSSENKLIESQDKKYCCFFYNIHEYSMSWYDGQIAVFENKQKPLIITNPLQQKFDFSSINPAIFDGDVLFLRKSAYDLDTKISWFPFIIINLENREFGFLDFDLTSLYYSPKRVDNTLFKLHLDSPKELANWKAKSRHDETFDLASITFYPLTLIDNSLELYKKGKSML